MSTNEITRDGELLSVRSAATRLGIARSTAYRLIRAGVIPAVAVDGSIRVDPAVLDCWLAEQATPKEAA